MSQPDAVEPDQQDALQYLSPPSPPGDNPVLEVHQVWGNLIVDSRQFRVPTDPVQIGEGTATRWTFLGVDMGEVPAALRPVLTACAPLWSEFATSQRYDFRIPDGIEDGWPLFVPDVGGGWLARIPPGWDHLAEADGGVVQARLGDDGVTEVRMDEVTRLVMERGEFRFVARRVPRSARLDARLGDDVDPWFLGLLAAASALFVGVALLASLSSPVREVADQDLDEPLVAMLLQAPPPPEIQVGNEGAKAKASDKPTKDKVPTKTAKKIGKLVTPKDVAGTAGIFSGSAPILDGDALPADLVAGVGHLIGNQGGGPGGTGLGDRGDGGCETGSLACGGNYEGHGGTGLRGDGPGDRPGGPTKEFRDPPGPASEAIVIGALDKAAIDEVVKRHTATIRYCYQRELQRTPGLSGKVTVKFTVSGDGSVSQASLKNSTMGAPAVESCIVARFMRMEFPKPRGGGIVVVSYPFLFAPN